MSLKVKKHLTATDLVKIRLGVRKLARHRTILRKKIRDQQTATEMLYARSRLNPSMRIPHAKAMETLRNLELSERGLTTAILAHRKFLETTNKKEK